MIIKSVFLPNDTNGNPVHAHGGQITQEGDYFYLIGESRVGRAKVACYRTKDFTNWEFRGNLLTVDSKYEKHPYMTTKPELEIEGRKANIGVGCNIERPKVIYNDLIKKYVMWMHWELPDDYKEARCAIATCDTIDGEYTYHGSFNPEGFMSRDCTLYKDEDGTGYFISAARDNLDLHIYKLSDDYLCIDQKVRNLCPGQHREAPTFFNKDGKYYLLSSGCTGWAPNQSSFAFSETTLFGDYTIRENFGDETTFRSQPTWVLKIKDTYYYIGDRWGGTEGYFNSQYVILPIQFDGDKAFIEFAEETEINL